MENGLKAENGKKKIGRKIEMAHGPKYGKMAPKWQKKNSKTTPTIFGPFFPISGHGVIFLFSANF